jgi:isoprenylcysteine carboxyl methyltransferase (ICMT) family protein YpbQ
VKSSNTTTITSHITKIFLFPNIGYYSNIFILEEKMKILLFIGIALLILLVLFLWSACALSSKISREEEMIESEK